MRDVYPRFQFDADGQLLPSLSEVVGTLTPVVATTWTIASWITTPHVQLDGRRPIDACANGELDAVVELARQWAADLTR